MCSTLPVGAVDYDDVLKKLNENILVNGRVDDLKESLFLYNPKFLQSHIDFTLHEDKVLTQDLIDEYAALTDGFERDKLVVKRILDCLDNREASLEQFPNLRKALVEHRL